MSKRRAASEDGDTSDSSADASARKRRGGHGARGALDAAPEFMQLSNEAAAVIEGLGPGMLLTCVIVQL